MQDKDLSGQSFDNPAKGKALNNDGKDDDNVGHGNDQIAFWTRRDRKCKSYRNAPAKATPRHDPNGSRAEFV